MAYNQQDSEFLQPLLDAVPGYPENKTIEQAVSYLNSTTFSYPILAFPKVYGYFFNDYNIGTSDAEIMYGPNVVDPRRTLTIGLSGNDTFVADRGWSHFMGGSGSDTFYVYKPQEVDDVDFPLPTIIWDFEVGSDRLFTYNDNDPLTPQSGTIEMTTQYTTFDSDVYGTLIQYTQKVSDGISTGDSGTLRWAVMLVDVNPQDFLDSFVSDGVVAGTDDNDVMGVGYADYAEDLVTNGADIIIGNGGNDSINAGGGDDDISGDDGNDRLHGGEGRDSVDGGVGDDLIYGENGNDRLYGGDGRDGMAGGAGVDIIHGDNGDDRLYGEDGNDYLYGDNGNDRLLGGNGSDRLRGGEGRDSLDGGDGNDLIYGQNGNDRLYGQEGFDGLDGGAGNDLIYGQNGNDRLYGGTGNDGLDGGAGDDLIYGQNGDDRLYGQDGRDRLFGDAGKDRLYGGDGSDLLEGGTGDDMLYGQSGNDRLFSDAGNDTLIGGTEGDTFIFRNGFGKDRIVDFELNQRYENIDLSAVTSIYSFTDLKKNHMSQSGNDTIIDAGGGDVITLANINMNDLSSSDFFFSAY